MPIVKHGNYCSTPAVASYHCHHYYIHTPMPVQVRTACSAGLVKPLGSLEGKPGSL